MTLSFWCCHILAFFLFLRVLGSRRKWSPLSSRWQPGQSGHTSVYKPRPPISHHPMRVRISLIRHAHLGPTLTWDWVIAVTSRWQHPFSMNGTCTWDVLVRGERGGRLDSLWGKYVDDQKTFPSDTQINTEKILKYKYSVRQQTAVPVIPNADQLIWLNKCLYPYIFHWQSPGPTFYWHR